MRQELRCSYEMFIQDVKSHQFVFNTSSDYIKEIENSVFNYPLFSSNSSIPVIIVLCIETWSDVTQSLVDCHTNNEIHQLLIHQEERSLKLAQQTQTYYSRKPIYGADCVDLCSIYHRPTEYTRQNERLIWNEFTSSLSDLVPSYSSFCANQQQCVTDYTILVERTRPCRPIEVINHPVLISSPVHEEIIQYYTTMYIFLI